MNLSKFLVAALVCAAPVWASGLPPILLPCGEVRLDPADLPAFRARLEESSRPAPTSVGESPAETGGTSRPGEPKGGDVPQTAVADRPVYVLQYDADETLSSAVRKAVAASGATLLSPVSGGAYLVRGIPAQALDILDSGVVAAGREYLPADKLADGCSSVSAASRSPGGPDGGLGVYSVSFFSDADPSAARAALSAVSGVETLDGSGGFLRVRAEAAALPLVAAVPSVQSVGPWLEPTLDTSDSAK